VIKDFGPRHAAAIGARHASADSTKAAGTLHPLPTVWAADTFDGHTATDMAGSQAPSPRQGDGADETPRAASPARQDRAPALGRRFLSAATSERRALLAQIENRGLAAAEAALPATSQTAVGELEAAALQRRPDAFARALERVLRIPGDTARRIVEDVSGEPVVIAAKALAVPADVLARILLFLNPQVGHSVERVFALVDLYEQLSLQAARYLAASWQTGYENPAADYRPLLWDDERARARHASATRLRQQVANGPQDWLANGE
jgi:hypothetical protein